MKVNEKQLSDQVEGLAKSKGPQKKSGANSAAPSEAKAPTSEELGSAKVKLSERAQDMKKVRDRLDATPDVDEAKVSKYKSMLARGEYKVDAKAVADKMVDEHAKNDFFISKYKDE